MNESHRIVVAEFVLEDVKTQAASIDIPDHSPHLKDYNYIDDLGSVDDRADKQHNTIFPTLKNERRKRKLVSFASTNLAEFSGQKVAPASYRSQALFLVNKSLSLAKN
ncbi:hypothetical protein P5673_013146 [Acropora cervicornis]|uniref:Uncharacterized protein n=1 Tax=Acropora cervicornis TaxID=6130 RepID=A0AAD9QLD0_ACRCE|nr:hypothetical protein P5673_013146 [Acropora cervicornis]